MPKLIDITSENAIPKKYVGTPISDLFCYQNMSRPFKKHDSAELLVAMCMDNRKQLKLPENFAFIIRTGGANIRNSEFKISFAIAIGGVKWLALIAHNHCGMVHLASRKKEFIDGLVEHAGWDRARAEEHFFQFAPMFEIGNEIDFVVDESKRLRSRYPLLDIVPLFYKLEDNLLYYIEE